MSEVILILTRMVLAGFLISAMGMHAWADDSHQMDLLTERLVKSGQISQPPSPPLRERLLSYYTMKRQTDEAPARIIRISLVNGELGALGQAVRQGGRTISSGRSPRAWEGNGSLESSISLTPVLRKKPEASEFISRQTEAERSEDFSLDQPAIIFLVGTTLLGLAGLSRKLQK